MTTTPNCYHNKCYSAYAATKQLGLFYTDNLIPDDNTHPKWEHVGQNLQIEQIDYCWRYSPENAQLCLDFSNQVWLRRPNWTGDNWFKILDIPTIKALTGWSSPRIGAVALNSTIGLIHVTVTRGIAEGSGIYMFTSSNNGATWNRYLIVSTFAAYDAGPITIVKQESHGPWGDYTAGQIMYIGCRAHVGSQGTIAFSRDCGKTWYPEENTIPVGKKLGIGGWVAYPCVDMGVAGSIFVGTDAPDGRVIRRYTGLFSLFDDGIKSTHNNGINYYEIGDIETFGDDMTAGLYIAKQSDIWYSNNPRAGSPSWSKKSNFLSGENISEIYIHCVNHALVGKSVSLDISPSSVYSTTRTFSSKKDKSGRYPNKPYSSYGYSTNSIPYDSGGISINGLVMWPSENTEPIPPDPPEAISGWPIWINVEARELRVDNSWDRLYVMGQTNWPLLESTPNFNNLPVGFQFVLSGYIGTGYLENAGSLLFIPTLLQGQNSMYSGAITYSGLSEARLCAPLTHGVAIAGQFNAEDDQVRYNDDVTHVDVLSGEWNLVGEFGAIRATSIAGEFSLTDLTVTRTDNLTVPENTVPTPWEWSTVTAVPFTVNCQFRESNIVWVGAENASVGHPIRKGLVSGHVSWEERGGGLPMVPVNDIQRGI